MLNFIRLSNVYVEEGGAMKDLLFHSPNYYPAWVAPLSIEFPRQEYWSGQPFPSPGDLPDLGIELPSPAFQAYSLPSEPLGNLPE